MEGVGGSKGKTAATRDKMKLRKVRKEDPKSSSPGLGSKSCEEEARLQSPRLRNKSRVDYNENTQLSGGDLFGESVEYKPVKGILKKPSTESNDEEDEEVTFSNEVARSLGLKRKRGGDAGGLDSNDDLERLQVKRRHQNSYSQDFKTEVVEKVKVVGNASKVARFYSTKLGFPVPRTTVIEWVKKSQESQEDDVVAQVGEEDDVVAQVGEEGLPQDETEKEVGESEEDTDEEENNDVEEENNDVEEENNDEEASEVDNDGEAKNVHLKKNEGEDKAEVGVIFDTHPVETPLSEACKKLRDVELKKIMLKKKKELLEMEEKNLQKEEEEQRLLLKKALE